VRIVAPGATPRTEPVDEIVATEGLLLDQVIARPVRTLPFASIGVADAVAVAPTASGELTRTDIAATGVSTTFTVAVAVFPSIAALIVAVPSASPVMAPVGETIATDESSLAQTVGRPVTTLPTESRAVTVPCAEPPTVMLETFSDSVRVATSDAGITVTEAVPTIPSLVAEIAAVPSASPVTTPFADTAATFASLEFQAIVLPESTLPAASRGVAMASIVRPRTTDGEASETPSVAIVCGCDAAVTTRVALPVLPFAEAVMTVVPTESAVTLPVAGAMDATAGFELAQSTVSPVTTMLLPVASLNVAYACAL
jgi:hypothetical protein